MKIINDPFFKMVLSLKKTNIRSNVFCIFSLDILALDLFKICAEFSSGKGFQAPRIIKSTF